MIGTYILKDKLAIPCEDIHEWGKFMEGGAHRVAETTIDGFWVSTVFLGIDYSFGRGEPLLFETMVFAKDGDETVFGETVEFRSAMLRDSFWGAAKRDSNWGDAEQSHKAACDDIRNQLEKARRKAENVLYAALVMEEGDV
ncbi:Uncharacterised protein [Ectopseudomonas mendocina]|uniref:Uncharacterized protein n=1 Tax=Ectopseudomonas mendocina TaxID=300 RepID=A0A379PPH3_ECTME|nr:hypothetical protein [Pseudomonas mendocina]SUE95903.1 Uncharacterised protein [Pseudomonas mendocina]